jgi:polyether ionophore transport system permease protein
MNAFAGTWPLTRLILRRDRVLMPAWVLVMALLPLSTASATAALYPTDAARQGYIDDLGKSALLIMFYGPKPSPSLGALIFWRLATGMLVMAIIGVLVAVRHTRVEEEAGRRELVRSGAVGRYADVAAALVATGGASLTVGLLVALGMISQHTPATGSFAMGLAWASAGIMFAGVGAVCAQLTAGAGAARGIGIVVVAVSFVLRAIGDVAVQQGSGPRWLSWTPPLGWSYQVRAYDDNRWWVFLLIAALTALLAEAAFSLSARRDLGAGLVASLPGPDVAAGYLRTPLALAWRLHRGSLIGWLAGFAAYGLVAGAVTRTAADLVTGNKQLADVMARLEGPSTPGDLFLASLLSVAGLVAAGYAISAALRMRAEESSLRVEQVLATPATRVGWVSSHLTFAVLGPAVALAAGGLASGLLYVIDVGDVGGQLPRALAGALVQLPAVWVLVAITVAVYGASPRLAAAVSWVALAVCTLLGQVGALLNLSRWVLDLSPFTHVPHVPGGAVTATPLVVMTVVAGALVVAGVAAFRRRDVPVT